MALEQNTYPEHKVVQIATINLLGHLSYIVVGHACVWVYASIKQITQGDVLPGLVYDDLEGPTHFI
jgi:hypothetical protein